MTASPESTTPEVCVVIPTYNHAKDLAETLHSLVAQRSLTGRFEVIVSDDGSSDGTADVARSFDDRLDLRYCYQPDRGFRAAAARNAGARLASAEILVFIDTGTLAGPNFVGAHYAALTTGRATAVVGYAYGYRPWDDGHQLAAALRIMAPERVVSRYQDESWLRDWRDDEFDTQRIDPAEMAAPWLLYQGMNCSVRTAHFWAAGGYDEEFTHWGVDDIELGYRLSRKGLDFAVDHEAWALEVPGPRDMNWRLEDVKSNGWYFLEKYREPVAEILWHNLLVHQIWPVEPEFRAVLDWTEQAQTLDVHDEIAAAADGLNLGLAEVVIFGCGPRVPTSLRSCTLVDFDATLLARAAQDGRHDALHALGVRTALADQSHQAVIITSRLAGLWDRWGDQILAEARRVAPKVVGPPIHPSSRSIAGS